MTFTINHYKGSEMRNLLAFAVLTTAMMAAGCLGLGPDEDARPLVIGLAERCRNQDEVNCASSYSHTIYAAGGVPLVLPATTNADEVARLLGQVDALVLCGGEDVEPARYNASPSPNLGKVNTRRDAWEYALLDEAVKRRIPVVGTCRGHQMINVYFGGTLWQDLPSEYGTGVKHCDSLRQTYSKHSISIAPGSRLSAMFGGATNAIVNSWHHQAVKNIAPGFKATAWAPDGVVEAIESETMPIASVQFHPELHFDRERQREFLVFFRRILEWAGGQANRR